MLTTYFLSVMAVAGAAVIWRNWLEGHPAFVDGLKRRSPRVVSKGLTCGSCFTYWLSLGFVLRFDPLAEAWPGGLMHVLVTWLALAMGAVFVRFSYVLVQERVHDIVHGRDRHTGHDHGQETASP
jgi:hypothetical protein